MLPDILPNLLPGPTGQRIDLQDVFLPKSVEFIKLQNFYIGPSSRLLPTQPRDPGIELAQPLL